MTAARAQKNMDAALVLLAARYERVAMHAVKATQDVPADGDDYADADGHEIAAQLGIWNIRAISGGRVTIRKTGITLPCGNGYSVTIDLAGNDTYTVRRIFTRAGKVWVKGERTDVYADQVGEVAYRAGMFRDVWAA